MSNSSVNRTNFQSFDKSLNAGVNLQSPFVSAPLDVGQYSSRSSTLAFIDTSVKNYQSLVDGINPGTEVHVLNASEDAISQITKTLLAREGISSLHIISHGQAGELNFASGIINSSNISNYAAALKSWSQALTPNADILLYGCNVASGELGTAFLQNLSKLTDADVAASNNLTGSAAKGGDWVLETVTGKIEASSALQMGMMEAYNSVLANINTPFRIINNPTPAANEEFGFAIASNGMSIVIGAPKGNGERGEAYSYSTGGLLQTTFLNPSTGSAERFGFAVALTGNNNSIIGAANFGDPDVGRAYQFDQTGINTKTFDNSSPTDDSEFGTAITVLKDGTIAIAAPERDKNISGDNAGQVRLFKPDGTISNINNPSTGNTNPFAGTLDPLQDARFGSALANADGNILIGAPGYFGGRGRAYLYNPTNGNLLLPSFNNPNSSLTDFFGISVASNSTGTRFLIGAPGEDLSGTDLGAAYLYNSQGTLLKTFTNPNAQIKGFGTTVAFIGNDIVVGAPGGFTIDNNKLQPDPSVGAVYIFDGDNPTTYGLEHTISNPNSENDGFGGAISVIDNNKIAIGAPYHDAGTTANAGIAYIFKLNNTAPSVSNISKSGNEDNTISFSLSDFTSQFTDTDTPIDGDSLVKIKITSLPTNGILKLSNTNVTLNQEILITDITNLAFTPGANFNGSISFKWNGSDGIAYGANDASVTLNINPINDAPTISTINKSGSEDSTISFSLLDFNSKFTDIDGDNLSKIKITSLPSNGILRLGGANVTQNQEILTADIANLTFTPSANFNGNVNFNWNGFDGSAYAANDETITITISPVNDAPTISTISKSGLENAIISFSAPDFTSKFTDVDGDILTKIRISSLPQNGTLKFDGINVTLNQEINVTDIYKLTFIPVSNYKGTTSFRWNGYDGASYSATNATVSLTINPDSSNRWEVVTTGDFDNDGKQDILQRNFSTGGVRLANPGGNPIVLQPNMGINWSVISTADFTGDSRADILWRNMITGENRVWEMNGISIVSNNATFRDTNTRTSADLNWQVVSTADFNGDNKADILWRHVSTGETVVWQMDGAKVLSFNTTFRDTNTRTIASNSWQVVSTADFNGDRRADILWRNSSTGETVVWQMDGAKVLSFNTTFRDTNTRTIASNSWQIVSTADFTGDRRADILWRNSSTGETVVWQMDGAKVVNFSSTKSNNQRLTQGTSWQVISTTDFNNDSNADILWRDTNTGEVRLWQMDLANLANIVVNSSIGKAPTVEWQLFRATDFYWDNKVDSLWVNSSSNQAKIVRIDTNDFGDEITV
ncbi:hypothetical protein NIES2101_15960 [Calothrix sp. HK-06]|nr:hypothetical protein NIES2101_15960 [Calothrix sp. HK-06]